MKTKLILILFLFFPLMLRAQSNFKNGYVIVGKNDTLKGLIDFKEWNLNPDKITFKKSYSDQPSIYSPSTISEFSVDGYDRYISYTGAISTDPLRVSDLGERDSSFRTATVFLKEIQGGETVSLYEYTDKLKTRFFLQDVVINEIQELILHKYREHLTTLKTEFKYKTQLLMISQKYHKFSDGFYEKVKNADYLASDLKPIIAIINGYSATKEGAVKKHTSRLLFGVGVNAYKTNFTAPKVGETNNDRTFLSPDLRFGVDMFSGSNIKQFIFRTTLSFTYLKNNNTDPASTVTFRFKQMRATINPQLIFNAYNTQKLKLFIGAGIGVHIAHTYDKYLARYVDGEVRSVNEYYQPHLKAITVSYPVRLGVVVKDKYEISAMYEYYDMALSEVYTHSVTNKLFQLSFNYLLN